jgi:GMP synthase (glutamine-hydrolysing)
LAAEDIDGPIAEGFVALRLLVVEGNIASDRELYRAGIGRIASERYAATLRDIAPDATCDICFAADADAALPDGAGLAEYDGVFITGSALNLYDGGPAIERQIELVRAVFAARAPIFGSCWGLQVACAAAGGVVARNPRGREIGIARAIRPTEAGRRHPMLSGRGETFDALCSHIDHVETAPLDSILLAANALSPVQAMEISHEGGTFWGVQYHPEYSLDEVAAIMRRRAPALAREGLFESVEAASAYADVLTTLDREPERGDLAERLHLGPDVLEPAQRRLELANFLQVLVRPRRAARA